MENRSGTNAKERYDRKRPVISVRVPMVQKRKVDEMARTSGKSVGRLVREGLGLQLRDMGDAYRQGYEKGCEETRQKYMVRVPCSCGQLFPVVGEDRIREVEEILMANCSWYHEDCRPEEVPESDCRLFKKRQKKAVKIRGSDQI